MARGAKIPAKPVESMPLPLLTTRVATREAARIDRRIHSLPSHVENRGILPRPAQYYRRICITVEPSIAPINKVISRRIQCSDCLNHSRVIAHQRACRRPSKTAPGNLRSLQDHRDVRTLSVNCNSKDIDNLRRHEHLHNRDFNHLVNALHNEGHVNNLVQIWNTPASSNCGTSTVLCTRPSKMNCNCKTSKQFSALSGDKTPVVAKRRARQNQTTTAQ